VFDDYEKRCQRHEVKLGRPYLFKRLVPPWVLNFPTKDHWRSVASLEAIVEGLKYLYSALQRVGDHINGGAGFGLWSGAT
jgi:hypothetical protein